jgi:hypothetical protein
MMSVGAAAIAQLGVGAKQAAPTGRRDVTGNKRAGVGRLEIDASIAGLAIFWRRLIHDQLLSTFCGGCGCACARPATPAPNITAALSAARAATTLSECLALLSAPPMLRDRGGQRPRPPQQPRSGDQPGIEAGFLLTQRSNFQ